MYGPVLSVLLMGMVPAWWGGGTAVDALRDVRVAPPASVVTQHADFGRLRDELSASGVIILDIESGQVVYEDAPDVARPMASLTKLMTALLVVEKGELDAWVTVPKEAADVDGTKANLRAGERYRVGDLLTSALVLSANDAAVALAHYHSGSVDAFVQEMNDRAKVLGLRNTSYENPVGLDAPLQRSTPRDVAWLGAFVLRFPEIADRMAMPSATIRSASGTVVELSHTHAMLHASTLVIAGKTGTTDDAGQCLMSVVSAFDRRYVVVLLRSDDRYADMRRALDVFND